MQVIDLFSGIGGFSLAARWAGWQTVQFCEIEPFCQAVLAHHWPGVPIHNDIKTLTREQIEQGPWRPEQPTIVVGGFPCQPYSAAGKRKGSADERHLWPEMLRIIREIQPKWVVGENVHGFVTWADGLVFEQAALDLEAAGYEVQSYVLPACGVNAPHKRDRVWIVAHAKQDRQQVRGVPDTGNGQAAHEYQPPSPLSAPDAYGNAANANGTGRGQFDVSKEPKGAGFSSGALDAATADTTRLYVQGCENGQGQTQSWRNNVQPSDWRGFPTQSPVCGRNDGIPSGLDRRRYRLHVRQSIQAYGNAIVPQVAYQIFRAINAYNALYS